MSVIKLRHFMLGSVALLPMVLSLNPIAAMAEDMAVTSKNQAFDTNGNNSQSSETEVIVTAQRRVERARDVPIALTTFNEAFLREQGISNLREASAYTPGLLVEDQSPNNPVFVMRGITSSGGDSFNEPRVSIFQDGVPISKSRGSFAELFDIGRIEIAKGPQSTLFGRGALIGGINIIQNHANPSGFDYSATLEGGNLDYKSFEGMLNVPLGDKFAVRLAGKVKERDGYVENLNPNKEGDLNAINLEAYRLSFAARPNDDVDIDFIVNYQSDTTYGTGFKSMYYAPTNPLTGAILAGTATDDAVWLEKPADFAIGDDLGVDQYYSGATLLMKFRLADGWTLNSTTGFRKVSSVEVYDPDGTSLPVYTSRENNGGEYISQEIRLNYDKGGKIKAFGGFSYYNDRSYS